MFQQTTGISMGTNCAPLLAELFLHAYEADFLQGFLKNKDRKLTLKCKLHMLMMLNIATDEGEVDYWKSSLS
jgi:hypothetical protein